MTQTVEMPLWLLLLMLGLAAVAALDKIMMPSVRWYFRRRLEKAVAHLNTRLERPIQPFKLARRYDMIQRLIYDPQVSVAIAAHAKEMDVPENVAFEEARSYAREIVPSFSASAYFGFAIGAARFLSNALYRVRLSEYDEGVISKIDPDATVIFVMNHRSNMDYVLVTYLAAQQSALSYAVGEWARVWPLSRLIKAMGAYFIRRKSRNELYRKVLARYVRLATDAGVTQAVFPEGGLSLTGSLMPPKLGLLKYILDGFDPAGRDVVFVPVALNYDRVLEDQILNRAANDPENRFKARIGVVAGKTLKQILLRFVGRYHRFGYAAVSIGQPLSLAKFSKGKGENVTVLLAQALIEQIGSVVAVLPVPVVSTLILKNPSMNRAEIDRAFNDLIDDLPAANVRIAKHDKDMSIEYGLHQMTARGLIVESDGQYSANPEQVEILQFYANSIRHLMPESKGIDP